ncbi:MAG: hypothetical protein ACLGIV_08610 [Actinomycetes bacterium]
MAASVLMSSAPAAHASAPHDQTAAALDRVGATAAGPAPDTSAGATDAGIKILSPGQGKPVALDDGTAVYRDALDSTDIAVQAAAEGVTRLLSVAHDASAPEQVRYVLPGSQLVVRDDGTVVVSQRGEQVATIEAPWAVDAAGKALPTRYETRGATLVQHVDFTGATFPVVADPSINTCGFLTYCLKFNRTETLRIQAATLSGMAATAATMCGYVPTWHWVMKAMKALCAGWVAANFASITSQAAYARRSGRCLAIRVWYTGLPLGATTQVC